MSCIECVALNIRHVFTTVADGCCKDGYEVPVQWPFMVAFCLCSFSQWELQDPKMEVLYHIRSYFGGICPYISLIEALYLVGTSNQSVPESWPLIFWLMVWNMFHFPIYWE